MGSVVKGRYVYCAECGSRQEKNGVCRICGHEDVPPLPGMVPDIVGLTQADAAANLTDPECQLTLGDVTTENSDAVAANLIISSDPVTGTQLKKKAKVNIVVSLGPAG